MSLEMRNASDAFQELVKILCLTEFPCGDGSWRNSIDQFADGLYSTTTKDYDVQHEKIETLHEFLRSGTWDVDTSWSNEAASLRRIAVSEPWRVTDKFVWLHFETLRLINKEIEELDTSLKKLENLKELTLSVNKLKRIPAELLPSKLKVLELCYNELQSISSLAKHPSALVHLGLSYNHLASNQEYKYFTVNLWPALMSLDLGYNDLVELVELVGKLSTLPNLQNLVLIGNPLSLIPGYRGHVVDAMKYLVIVDDSHVSSDEKHHFKGLGKKKELILDEAQLVISLEEIRGIPMPEDIIENDEKPEFPMISISYYVEYEMLPDDVHYEENNTDRVLCGSRHTESDVPIRVEENVTEQISKQQTPENVSSKYRTEHIEWNEESISLKYRKTHVTDDLIGLRDFLKYGVKFTIYEEKNYQWPMTPVDEDGEQGASPNPKKGRKDAVGKDTPSKAGKGKEKPNKESAKKGKKKAHELPSDMRSDPPVITEVGSCHIPLGNFIDGDSEYMKICHCSGGPMPAVTVDDTVPEQAKMDSSKPVQNNEKISQANGRTTKSSKAANKKKENKVVDNCPQSQTNLDNDEEKLALPPPITLSVNIHLVRWKTAADSIKHV